MNGFDVKDDFSHNYYDNFYSYLGVITSYKEQNRKYNGNIKIFRKNCKSKIYNFTNEIKIQKSSN